MPTENVEQSSAVGYKRLVVWKEAHGLVLMIYKTTKTFPKDELFGLTSQLRRAVVSIAANIVEGQARSSTKDFRRYIDMARGSLLESRNHFYLSQKKGYISPIEFQEIDALIEKIFFKAIGFQKWLSKNDLRVSREHRLAG